MTAYHFDTVVKELPRWKHKQDFCELFADCHITSISTGNLLRTKRVFVNTKYLLTLKLKYLNSNLILRRSKLILVMKLHNLHGNSLIHSFELLLNRASFTLSCFITLDKFLVSIKSRLFQVDPVAFFLNNTLFIEFKLIDYQTKAPLKKDEIYGKAHNFNLISVDGIQYFSEDIRSISGKSIPNLILDNILRCFQQLTHHKYRVDSLSFAHNLLVISNSIDNINTYFADVLGAYGLNQALNNINTNRSFEYYSQEYLGVATAVSHDAYQQALFDCQLFRSIKDVLSVKSNCQLGRRSKSDRYRQ